jgi:hypothetical protein
MQADVKKSFEILQFLSMAPVLLKVVRAGALETVNGNGADMKC